MNELENEMTPLAEFAWKLYAQLLRSGFERLDALHIVESMLREMVSSQAGAMK